jgi:two-component system LytT family response regulator
VGEAVDGRSALALCEQLQPNLLFLDVRLPELSGLDVARQIRHPAEIVFTTAYDRFAVAAFELGAVDYLVKPFGRERFAAALARVRARLGGSAVPAGERIRSSLEAGPLSRLFARHGDRIVPIAVEGVRRIQAQGDYAEVHCAEGVFLLHVTLSELAARLDPARFRQVHRSHIVNLDAVEHMRAHDDRRLAITLRDGSVVVASRAASEELRRLAR